MDGIWEGERRLGRLLLRHITGQFFKKEWIAIGFRHDLVQQRPGHLGGGEQGLHHLGTVVGCQP
jgi:hypothetical protein